MHDKLEFPHQRLSAYKLSKELAILVRHAGITHAELRDQAERASVSVFLALNEGLPHTSKKMRKQYFERAKASLCEVVGAIDLARELGAMSAGDWAAAQAAAARTCATVIGLLRTCA